LSPKQQTTKKERNQRGVKKKKKVGATLKTAKRRHREIDDLEEESGEGKTPAQKKKRNCVAESPEERTLILHS